MRVVTAVSSAKYFKKRGFALPTVLIASIVLLSILAVTIAATSSIRTSLKEQYYAQLAQVAGEAGVAYAKACLAQNGNVPLWTDQKPLKPSTDCMGNEVLSPVVRALVVAGGGSGGSGTGGGGGGGGVVYNESVSISVGSYPVVVGAGGASPPQQTTGNNGGNSSFAGISATGGGGGAHSGTSSNSAGKNGGSGGGGQSYNGLTSPGTGVSGQGYAGGIPVSNSGSTGGGGAGGPGLVVSSTYGGGAGGPGVPNSISGSTIYYSGGGGGASGGSSPRSPGGVGGGGFGALEGVGGPGEANTGGGGGGGWSHAGGLGGAGGSGIVIIAYPSNSGIVATGGTINEVGVYKIHTFTSSGTFSVSDSGSASCPTDSRCYVFNQDNIRSSFSVPRPALNSDGQAATLAHGGYVEILRTSGDSVWRTYRQPSVQASVVPELCSSAISGSLGWSRAALSSNQDNFSPSSTARTISMSTGNVSSGNAYYRKDFSITNSGNYTLSIHTPSTLMRASVYVDGNLLTTTAGSLKSANVSLGVGCHYITVKLTGDNVRPSPVRFTAALNRSGQSTSTVATDSGWYVSAGEAVHFSDPNYYADPNVWDSAWGLRSANQSVSTFGSTSGDQFAYMISTSRGYSGGTWTAGTRYFRDGRDFVINSTTNVRVTSTCIHYCEVFLNGSKIHNTYQAVVNSTVITLQPGTYRFGVALTNNSTSETSFALAAVDTSSGNALARSDARWLASTVVDTSMQQYYSFDESFRPSPKSLNEPTTARVMVIAGGGGGAGNCTSCGGAGGGGAGGLLYNESYPLAVGSTSVTIGSGGARGAAGSNSTTGNGSNGGNSSFGSMTAIGGGGGRAQNAMAGGNGGSGGAGSGGGTPAPGAGGSGTTGQGYYGGAGDSSPYGGGGGGGSAGHGMPGTHKNGGTGWTHGITGTMVTYAGGGGGGAYDSNAPGIANGGGGNGNNVGGDANGFSAAANTGGGGGGGNGSYRGGQGGLGGSGTVIIAYKTGTATATGGTVTTANGYTIHKFDSNGTFTVSSVNSNLTSQTVEYLAVGGGGGGGNLGASGGGGAGGMIESNHSVSMIGSYSVIVGSGGGSGASGGDSSVFGAVALGGGGGSSANGLNGGSGGGSGRSASSTSYFATGSPGQGNNGGTAGQYSGQYPASGGGGAGGNGGSVTASPGTSGAGGIGRQSSITGSNIYYAAGGGGGGDYGCSRNLAPGSGGSGGGGAGGNSSNGNGIAGTANTGSGGGGATQLSNCSATGVGGVGGSGVVIIRYVTGTLTATGGSVTQSGGYTIHRFTSSGTFTVTSIQ